MSTTLPGSGLPVDEWPIRDDDPFVNPDRIPDGVDPGSLSRFGASRWVLSSLACNDIGASVSVDWDRFDDPQLRSSFRRAGWGLVNLPAAEELLERKATNRAKWLSPYTIVKHIRGLRSFAAWLTANSVIRLDEVTTDDLEDYAAYISGRGNRGAVVEGLYAVSLLWGFAPHLPAQDRIPMPPWETVGLNDFAPAVAEVNENTTPPIHPAVMSPLLIWALRFVEDFADDIIAAWAEHQRLMSRTHEKSSAEALQRIKALIQQHVAEDRPLPGSSYHGRLVIARTYLAGVLEARPAQVRRTIEQHGAGLAVSTETPLNIVIRGACTESRGSLISTSTTHQP